MSGILAGVLGLVILLILLFMGMHIGLAMALLTYPLYKGILNSRKKKYSDRIFSLSEKIMNQKAE